jgi:ribosomal protein S18 acetylase RimI-like enzyme
MKTEAEVIIQNFENGHLENVVTLHETCFAKKNNFTMCFGHAFVCKTYQFFLNDEKAFGFVAICNGQIVGVLLGRLDYHVSALNAYRFSAGVKGLICNPTLLFSKRVISQGVKILIRQFFHKDSRKKLKPAPSHQDGRTATVASVCVHPDYRNLKIGGKLLAHAEELCRQNHMVYLRAGIQDSNVASRSTFHSRGYIEDEILRSGNDLFYYLPLKANL